MGKQFWEIIKDDRSKSYEVLKFSSDDTALTNLTCDMQKVGLQVRCETSPYPSTTKESISTDYSSIGFKEEKGLMARLKQEYAELALKQGNSK